MERNEIPDELHQRIKARSAAGDRLAKKGKFKEAIAEYDEAWQLLPTPRRQWNAAVWLLTAIVDAAFLGGYLKTARKALDDLLTLEGAVGNPFIHLRNGQVLFEEGALDEAAEQLMLAYMAEGKRIFSDDDPKYYAFLGTRARDLE